MGLSVSIEYEDCTIAEVVSDPQNLLHLLLPDETAADYVHVNMVDWYGHTSFNYLQMPRFLDEWTRLEEASMTPETNDLLRAIRRLAERVRDTRHEYLVFRGD